MSDAESVIAHVRAAFADTPHPGDAFLRGSFDGTEPLEVVEAFSGVTHWTHVGADVLDSQSAGLSFLSEGGFRFFLPAYLVADLRGALQSANPVFFLTNGFSDDVVVIRIGSRTHERAIGGSAFVNPRRYGAMTWSDHAHARLSVFAREEAAAIVGYLEYRRAAEPAEGGARAIDEALASFWRERAANAPSQENLRRHLEAEEEYLRELTGLADGGPTE